MSSDGYRQPWKVAADGRTVFRRGGPFVFWWAWLIFAVVSVAQVAIPDHNYFSAEFTFGLLVVTAIVYATALRPRVIADVGGIDVVNPFRNHRIGWGGLNGVQLGDSVEFTCARAAPRKDKTIYSWALYSGRRSRFRAELRAERRQASPLGAASRVTAAAPKVSRLDPVQLMATEIGRQCTEARQRGAPETVLESAWAWLPLGYLLVPAAVLAGLVLAR